MRDITVRIHSVMIDGKPDMHRLTGRIAFVFEGGVRSGWPVPNSEDSWEDSVTGRVFLGITHWIEFPEPLYHF